MKAHTPLLLFLWLTLLPIPVHAQFEYTTDDGQITITRYTGPGGAVDIPSSINSLPVTRVGDDAFSGRNLASVTFPDSVTTVGSRVFFSCPELTNVVIGSGMFEVGDRMFASCTGLTHITIPDGIDRIGVSAFQGCSRLASVTFSANVTEIADRAFLSCTNLAQIALPDRLARIGRSAFGGCLRLADVTFPHHSFVSTDFGAFAGCVGLTNVTLGNGVGLSAYVFNGCDRLRSINAEPSHSYYTSIDGVLFSKDQSTLIQYPPGKSGSYVVPDSVTAIGFGAFLSVPDLTSITLGRHVHSIGTFAFSECGRLGSVNFLGNAPSVINPTLFTGSKPTIYHVPGAAGWGETFNGRPTAIWSAPYPVILAGASIKVQNERLGFTISWAKSLPVLVEASTTASDPVWVPVGTNTTTGGTFYFSDPQWSDYPTRFYRVRGQ